MKTYFRYVYTYVIKRKTTWITGSILWLYIWLIIIFVPAILNLAPLSIWNNNSVALDVKTFALIILAIFCAINAVIVFRDGKDDGNELLIAAKPINRKKIVFVKFCVFLCHCLSILLVSLILFFLTLTFGPVSTSNPDGISFTLLGQTIASFILGGLITILVFSAIAILISMLTGKIVILVGTIGLAILINIIHLIIPILSSDPRKYINDHYGISFVSCKYYDTGTNQLQNVVTVDNLSEVDRDTLYYANIAQKHNTNQLSAYLDIAGGLTNIYQPLDGSNNDTNLNSPYGELTTQKYVIPNTQPIKIDNNHAMPLIHIGFTNDSKQYIKSIKYYVYGLPLEWLSIYSFVGFKSDTVAGVIIKTDSFMKRITSERKLYSFQDLFADSNIPAIQKISDESWLKIGDTASEVTRDKFVDFINNTVAKEWLAFNTTKYFENMTFAQALLGEEINWNNPAQATDQINLAILKLKFLLMSRYNLEFYKNYFNIYDSLTDENLWTEYYKSSIASIVMRDIQGMQFVTTTSNAFVFDSNEETKINIDPNKEMYFWKNYVDSSNSMNNLYNYYSQPYISTTAFAIFWSIFSFTFFVTAIVIYARTDFK